MTRSHNPSFGKRSGATLLRAPLPASSRMPEVSGGAKRPALRIVLQAIGVAALAVVVIGASAIGLFIYKGNSLDAESRLFVDNAVPAFAAKWNDQALLALAAPELRASVDPEKMKLAFSSLSRIGLLVRYEGAKGDANMAYLAGAGSSITALYVAKARFQAGDVAFKLDLVKKDGHWMIRHLQIDPTFTGEKLSPA